MIIENPDAFKTWLTSILEPLCDADPAALAKYVYALVKKDKPLEELRDGMLDQLDVFLQEETKPFVEMLFKALDSQEYLKPVEQKKDEMAIEPEVPAEEPQPENHGLVNTLVSMPTEAEDKQVNHSPPAAEVKEPPRHRVVVPRRPPQHEQTLVKVLPTELLEEPVEPPRRRDRRGDLIRDKDDRRRRRSRSWERRSRARRHPRDDGHPDRRYDKRRPSRSPSPRGRYRNRSPPTALLDRQPSRSRSRSPVTRDRDLERERDRLRPARELERDRMSRDREHRDRLSRSRDRERSRDRSRDRTLSPHDTRLNHNDTYKRRCRDFDVKGYCMRGDLCEWDHGVDPVVLEDAALTRVLALPPPVPEYNPATPDIWVGGGFAGFPPVPHHPPAHHMTPRELVPIPRVRHEMPTGAMIPPMPRHPPPMKKNFDYNRLGSTRPPFLGKGMNCSLEVKKVPHGLNDITHLNNHFGKFGKIVNIQVCFEGDPEAALVTFSNPTEANVAYKSTEAVLNNRFIKLFWHNPENKQENSAPIAQQKNQNSNPLSHNKVYINKDNIKASEQNKQKEKLKETNGETEKKDEKPLDKYKEVMERYKRAQVLLQTQLTQQKVTISKLESGNVSEEQKTEFMETIKAAQGAIEKLRKELVAYNGMIKHLQEENVSRSMSRLQLNQVKKPKTAAEAQKEILDAELDIITKQQEGQDVTELAKKIVDMRRKMSIQFPSHTGVRKIHSRGGRFNPAMRYTRNAAAPAPKTFSDLSVDHRPRTLLISGFEPDELEAVQTHFAKYGEIVGKVVNMSVPELTVQYKIRPQAEMALMRGRNYNDRTLSITWVANNKPLGAAPSVTQNGDAPPQENSKDTQNQEQSEDFRFDEEDEDEADEDRSWRR